MHAWGAVDLRIYLAKKNHGYSISAQSYDFCPCLIKLDILDFTVSHILQLSQMVCGGTIQSRAETPTGGEDG